MDYKNILQAFWGEIPTFHDAEISGIYLEDNILTLDIATHVSRVLHPKAVCEKYEYVYTSIKFESATITKIDADRAGIIINKFIYSQNNGIQLCCVDGVLGGLEFTFSQIIDIVITTKAKEN